MKIADLIAELQNYDPDMEVYGMCESLSWDYNEWRGSVEKLSIEEKPISLVERFRDGVKLT